MRNNYDKDVYNGDMGIITQMDLELQKLAIDFDGRVVLYDFLELDELTHAFAISVHKSQGSEFPAVVIPVMTTHYMMLQRNLLYTAITRARRLVVLVGQPRAIALAVRNNKVTDRHSGLRTGWNAVRRGEDNGMSIVERFNCQWVTHPVGQDDILSPLGNPMHYQGIENHQIAFDKIAVTGQSE